MKGGAGRRTCTFGDTRIIFLNKKDTGLSVALLISVVIMSFTKAMVSFTTPWTYKRWQVLTFGGGKGFLTNQDNFISVGIPSKQIKSSHITYVQHIQSQQQREIMFLSTAGILLLFLKGR